MKFLGSSKAAFPPKVAISSGALPAGVVPSAVACLCVHFQCTLEATMSFLHSLGGDGMLHSTVVEATKLHIAARASSGPWKSAELSVRDQVPP